MFHVKHGTIGMFLTGFYVFDYKNVLFFGKNVSHETI